MHTKVTQKWFLALMCLIITFRICTINIHGSFNIFYYDLLAKNFTLGKLYVKNAPEELLKLTNPYDSNLNEKIRIQKRNQDLCLYKGKLYMHWGPVPALVIAPFKFFFHVYVMNGFIFLLVLTATQVLLANTLWSVTLKKNTTISIFLMIITTLTLGLLPGWSIISSRIAGYEIGVVFNQFFIAGFLFFFFQAYKKRINSRFSSLNDLILSSFSLGLAIGTRFSSICLIPVFLLALYFWINLIPYDQIKTRIINALALAIPLTVCILLVLVYNYIRFDNFFEYGQKWVLSIDPLGFNFLDASRIFPNLYYNFLILPELLPTFPYLKPSFPLPLFWMSLQQIENFPYKLASCINGFFTSVPISIIVFIIPYLKKKINQATYQKQKPMFIFFTLSITSSLCLLIPYLCTGVSMRYNCEWTFLWLCASLSATQIILNNATNWSQINLNLFKGLIIIFTIWTSVTGILLGFDKTYAINPILPDFYYPLLKITNHP